MVPRQVRAALITPDPGLRETVVSYSRDPAGGLSLVTDLNLGLDSFSSAQFRVVQQSGPAMVLVDLEGAPELAISLARDLIRALDDLVVVGIAPALSSGALSSELLLKAMRAGVAEVLEKPLTANALAEAMTRLRPRLAPANGNGDAGGQILAFFSPKGGSGATTAVINLAVVLHRLTEKKTLVVDLDAELGEVAVQLGVQPQFNFVDLVENFHRMDTNLLSTYIEQHTSGIHLLSAPFHPDRAAGVTADQIRRILYYLKGQYDYILLDTSKSFAPEVLAAFEQSDQVYLLATVDLPSLRNIQRALPMLRRVMPHGLERVHLVLNRFESGGEILVKDVEKSLDRKVYATLANDYESVIRSLNSGRPVVLGSPRSAYARDITALARRIAEVEAEDVPEQAEEGTGLLRRLFKGQAKPALPDGEMKRV